VAYGDGMTTRAARRSAVVSAIILIVGGSLVLFMLSAGVIHSLRLIAAGETGLGVGVLVIIGLAALFVLAAVVLVVLLRRRHRRRAAASRQWHRDRSPGGRWMRVEPLQFFDAAPPGSPSFSLPGTMPADVVLTDTGAEVWSAELPPVMLWQAGWDEVSSVSLHGPSTTWRAGGGYAVESEAGRPPRRHRLRPVSERSGRPDEALARELHARLAERTPKRIGSR